MAKKCAMDGAKVVIAAKTVNPHPTLPGTIFTAAKEVEEAGGEALPIELDIRYEDQIVSAVEKTVSEFGGIDVLINNAAAISITDTENTTTKKYDLMHDINGRGVFLMSKLCIPHLLESAEKGRDRIYPRICKVGCAFPVVIWSESRLGSIETTTIEKTHPTVVNRLLNR